MLSTKMIVIISLLTVAILLFLSRKILDGFLSRYIFYTRLKIMLGFATFRKIIQVLFYLLIIAGFIFLTFIIYDYIWKSLNQMIINLSTIIGSVNESVIIMNTSVNELVSTAEEQSAGASQQASSLSETSSTVEEFAITSKQIEDNSNNVLDMSNKLFKIVKKGIDIVINSNNTMLETKNISIDFSSKIR